MNKLMKKMKASKTMRLVKIIFENAAFAFLLSIILFGLEMYDNIHESREITKTLDSISSNLVEVQSSLSTRYLGEFPDFVHDIDSLYGQTKPGDTIVILEDVLFYGIYSAPVDFYNANVKLLELAEKGSPVSIAYYKPYSMAYDFMLPELLLAQEQYKYYRDTLKIFRERNDKYKQKRREIKYLNLSEEEKNMQLCQYIDSCFQDLIDDQVLKEQKKRVCTYDHEQKINVNNSNDIIEDDFEIIRKMLLKKYFAKTRDRDPKAFKEMVQKYRHATIKHKEQVVSTNTHTIVYKMCQKMDSIRWNYLGKEKSPVDKIEYSDFENMFTSMTNVMVDTYRHYNIRLIPMENFVSVRSWLICDKRGKSKAIMAFPSRYSSSEIGFYTTDKSTKNYILTMQKGIELEQQ